ncbi:MAG: hypothetical protein QOJ65_2796 [Fimbriimonadaceae bacterium]|jgi:hypothetical protein|nr:hypothetical protein [Fimbriimonadaceae bacterium]
MLLLIACAAVCGVYFARAPWVVYREQRAKANDSITEAHVNEAQRASLMKREAEFSSPIGREKLARAHNFVQKGEVLVATDAP